jgi:molecular chaperone HtpG
MIREEKFYEKVKDVVVFKTTDDVYKTLGEYREKNKGINKEQNNKEVILYATNEEEQIRYINLIKSQGYEALLVDTLIDIHFLQFLETKDTAIHFMRVDSDDAINIIDESKKSKIVDENNKTNDDKIKDIFESVLKKDDKSKVQIKVEPLKDEKISAMVVLPEFLRRFKEMNFGMKKDKKDGDFFNDYTLLVNSNNKAVQNIFTLNSSDNKDKVSLLVMQVHDLALLSQNNLKGEDLLKFLKRSEEILESF